MRRSHRFPYTARSLARTICHAVSIDERRAKFRQDLISQKRENHERHRHPYLSYFRQYGSAQGVTNNEDAKVNNKESVRDSSRRQTLAAPEISGNGGRERFRSISRGRSGPRFSQAQTQVGDERASFVSCMVSDFLRGEFGPRPMFWSNRH